MEQNERRGEILIYQMEDGTTAIDVKLENETVWLTQKQIALLFGVNRSAVTKHLKNIFECGELERKTVCSILEQTAADGKTYQTAFYNLDARIVLVTINNLVCLSKPADAHQHHSEQ